jgi:hypothetical protein
MKTNKENFMKKSMLIGIRSLLPGVLLTVGLVSGTLATELHVPSEYATIQAAVDAASFGDSIRIAPGDYYEQIVIADKGNLTLAGEPGSAIHAFSGMIPKGPSVGWDNTAGLNAITVLLAARSQVVLANLTFDGAGLGDTYPNWLWGIIFGGCNARIENCTIQGFQGALLTDTRGISVNNHLSHGTPVVNVSVLNSTFTDNIRSIVLFGAGEDPALLRTTFTIEGNTFVGLGATFPHAGLLIFTGAGGTVRGNTMTGFSRNTIGGFSAAIVHWDGLYASHGFLPVQPVRYEGNTFSNNADHLVLAAANESQIANNVFHGTGLGTRWGGLAVSGTNIAVANNDFSGMANGIVLFGNDVWGTANIPPASNVSVLGNWFCDVSTPLSIHSGATGIQQQSTQTCPFRPLLLSITGDGPSASLAMRTWHGQPVVVEASTDLQAWVPIHTNIPTLPIFKCQDPASTVIPQRFYRGVLR